jgi:hypothetical protein
MNIKWPSIISVHDYVVFIIVKVCGRKELYLLIIVYKYVRFNQLSKNTRVLSLEEAFGRTALIWMLVSKTTVGGFDLRSSQNKDNKY